MNHESHIQAALQQALTIHWLAALESYEAEAVAAEYSAWKGWPIDEIIGALDQIHDSESLTWLYGRYYHDIECWGDSQY